MDEGRRRLLPTIAMVLVFGPPIGAVLAFWFGGPQFRAGYEIGLAASAIGAGVIGITATSLRLSGHREPTWHERRHWVGRHPWALLLLSIAFVVFGIAEGIPDVADWFAPPDRIDVTVARAFDAGWRSRHTYVVTADGAEYSTPAGFTMRVATGPATLVLGHYSHKLIDVDRAPARIVAGGPPPAAPASLAATNGGAMLVVGTGAFWSAGTVGAWWYVDSTANTLDIALTGADPARTGSLCILVSRFVDGEVADQTIAETGPGTCPASDRASPACRIDAATFLVRTDVAADPDQVLAEIHVADGRAAAFAGPERGAPLASLDGAAACAAVTRG